MIFLMYLLKSGVCAAILWVAYYALLRKETHFAFNRFYLLSVIPLSSIIPWLRLPLLTPEEPLPLITIGEISAEPLAAPATQSFSFATLLLVIYFSGVGFVAFRFCRQLYRMHRVIAASRFSDTKNYSAFTFFRKIYINRSTLSAGDYEKILWHEQVHARQLHSVDLVIAQLFVTLQWFNPFAWCLKKSIVATHEYLADAQVLAHGVDVNIYQKLLFHQTTGVHPEYANGFSYSLTKKRLIMMTKNNTGKFFALKLCCMLPAIALPVAMFGLSTADANPPVNFEKAAVMTTANDTLITTSTDKDAKSDGVVVITMKSGEVMAFGSNELSSMEALAPDDIQSITVSKPTSVKTTTAPSVGTGKITVVMKSGETRVFDENNIQDLNAFVTGDIQSITIQKDTVATKKSTSIEYVHNVGQIDVNPEFPGGIVALMKFIQDNLKYPKKAADKKTQGRVIVQFTVKANGNIDDVKVLKGADALLDEEAVRIVKTMPKWKPGEHEGKAVAVNYLLPVMFQLNKDKEAETKYFKVYKVYQTDAVDEQPQYPGGMNNLMDFIKANLKYPQEAAKQKIQGRVTVQFTVKDNGTIDNVTVLKSVNPLLDAEAVRLVKSMPKWTPGKHEGEAVAVQFILPITFRL
ncbi:MAG: M56 family metallopeptidase [Prevotellaceae bacterium]|jgi:TonB family protein|nr:M56 family metallopeptidase [Prevotellaceae bacterium]